MSDRVAQDGSTDNDIWVVNADGSGTPTNLTNNYGGLDEDSPARSPDGSKIAFNDSAGTIQEIFVMNSDGSSLTQVTDPDPSDADGDRNFGWQARPAFSPDGSKIAFFDDLTDEVWAMNADGSGTPVNVSNAAGINDQPDWAPLNFDLSLVQSDTPDLKVSGNLIYTLDVTNEGFDDAPGVVLTDTDPAHGAATLGADNTVRYVPDASYTGPDSFTYTVADPGGATDTATVSVTVSDTKTPTVVKPLPIGRNVLPTANVTALSSEPMAAGTLFEAATGESVIFVLKKGTVKVPATVSYNPGTLTAVLDPDAKLRRGATYTATVTTGAKDEAGTPLDQDPNTAGNQDKVWSFNIKP